MSANTPLPSQAGNHGHCVQFYKLDERALYANVASYIAEGFAADEAALVVATAEHSDAFFQALEDAGVDCAAAVRESRLVFLDAKHVLARIMVDGYPNAAYFASVVGDAVREMPVRAATGGVRVFGEMVGVLWEAGEYPAAIRLEQLWDKLREDLPCRLFCGYPIDLLDTRFEVGLLDAVLSAHTHMLPATNDKALERAAMCALEEVVANDAGGPGRGITGEIERPPWAVMPESEARILWLRRHHPEKIPEVMARLPARGA